MSIKTKGSNFMAQRRVAQHGTSLAAAVFLHGGDKVKLALRLAAAHLK